MRPLYVTFVGGLEAPWQTKLAELADTEVRRGWFNFVIPKNEYVNTTARLFADARRLRSADIVVAVAHSDIEPEELELRSFHLGYAAALGKKVILIDWLGSGDTETPLMLAMMSWRVTSVPEVVELLKEMWYDHVHRNGA